MREKNASEWKSLKLKGNTAQLKIHGNYQPSPQKKVEEKRREGEKEESAHSIGLDLKKLLWKWECAGNEVK